MAKDNKIHLPSSGGGLIRYSEDSKSKLEINPIVIVAVIVLVIIIEIVLYKGFI